MKIIGFIPARGGSKSIHLKNIVKVNKVPLIHYSISAALKSGIFSKIVCSSDSNKILDEASKFNISLHKRKKILSEDSTNVLDVIINYIEETKEKFDLLYLIQPTSIFVLPMHFKKLKDLMIKNKSLLSAQSITETNHNFHPINSRYIINNNVKFLNQADRLKYYNKQKKPKTFHFGNLIVVKRDAILKYRNFFCEPCGYLKIKSPYDFDLDNKFDHKIAELYLQNSIVKIDHMN